MSCVFNRLQVTHDDSTEVMLWFDVTVSPPSSSVAMAHGPFLLTLKKRIQAFKTKCLRNFFLHLLLGAQGQWLGAEQARSASLWFHRNPFWQLSRDRHLDGSSMSHATTSSPKPSFRAPWRVGDAMGGRGNAGQTTSKSGHPCRYQNWVQEPPAGKTARRPLLNRSSCSPPPPHPTPPPSELNWTDCFDSVHCDVFMATSSYFFVCCLL